MLMRMMLIKMMITVMIMQTDLIVAERRMTVRVRQVTHRAQRQDTYLVASYMRYVAASRSTQYKPSESI